jgi:hypothetical protein
LTIISLSTRLRRGGTATNRPRPEQCATNPAGHQSAQGRSAHTHAL